MKRLISFAACALVLFAGCSDSGTEVDITDDQRFDPETITVGTGDTITFANASDASHSVTAYEDDMPEGAEYFSSGDFSSEQAARDSVAESLLTSGATFEVTLEEPGTYEYFCIPHEGQGMTGTIVVEE